MPDFPMHSGREVMHRGTESRPPGTQEHEVMTPGTQEREGEAGCTGWEDYSRPSVAHW